MSRHWVLRRCWWSASSLTILRIREQGTTILLVEQNARAALSMADRGYVLEVGNVVLEGTGQQLLDDKRVQDAYLGGQVCAT